MSSRENEMKGRMGRKIVTLILVLLCAQTLLRAIPEKNEFEIAHFSLDIEVIPDEYGLKGEATIRLRSGIKSLKSIHFYLRPSLRLKAVKDENDNALVFSQNKVERIFPNSETSLVRVQLDQELSEGETVEIVAAYDGIFYMPSDFNPKERRYNRAFSSVTKEAAWLRPAQLWYPYIANKSMPLTIKAKVPSEWTVITNGELESTAEENGKKIFVFQEGEISSLDIFLFAASYVSKSKKIGDFHITAYFFPYHKDFLDPYIEKTEEILSFYTQKFGAPDVEKFNIIEIGKGYGTGTSSPFGYGISSHLINLDFPLIPHEIAHLWWGETVSDNLGEDTWLHEGLATFSDYCYRSEKAPDKRARREVLFGLLNKAVPIGNPKTLSILEGGAKHADGFLVYERAAFVVQTLKHILGEELFLKAMRSYIETFRGKIADTAGLIQVVNSVSQRDLNWFFDYYLRRGRLPRYRAKSVNVGGKVRGTLYQENVPKQFKMPLTLEFLTNKRSFRRKVDVKGSKKKFSFDLERGENVLRVTIDPDFEVLGVRDVLEDRWEARSLRLEAAEEKNFQKLEPFLFSLSEKNPDNAHILHEVGQFYFAQQKWEKGIEIYQKILSLEPDDFTFIALGNIAAAYELMGDKKMQRFYLEKALAKGSSMYSIVRSLMDKLEKLKE
jgi:aminopeptidase N